MQINKSILCTAEVGNDAVHVAAINGIDITVIPFISIRYAEDGIIRREIVTIKGENVTVVFTSKNAVAPVADAIRGEQVNWQVFCLGNKTQKEARRISGSECVCVTESSEELARSIIQSNARQVHFFCGDMRLDTLPDILKTAGVSVHEHIVYRTTETPHVSNEEYDGILFFSPSGARSFFSANKVNEKTVLFAIGTTTAAEVRKYSHAQVKVSPIQSKEGVITTAINYFKNKTI